MPPRSQPEPRNTIDCDIADQLIAALRTRLEDPSLNYAELPARIAGGFETLTYGFSLRSDQNAEALSESLIRPLVLRIFQQKDPGQSRREAAFQNSLADAGFTVPRVVAQFDDGDDGISGLPFNVMERVPGRPMVDIGALASGELALDEQATVTMMKQFAKTHVKLHEAPSEPVIEALERAGFQRDMFTIEGRLNYLTRYFQDDTFAALRSGYEWLLANRPAVSEPLSVCHGDFHPGNIMVDGSEVSGVIDWPGAAFAEPEFDVATSLVLIRISAGQVSEQLGPVLTAIAKMYLSEYNALWPLDMQKLGYYEALRCFRAYLRGTALTTQGVNPELAPRDSYPWASEQARQSLKSRLTELTGLELGSDRS